MATAALLTTALALTACSGSTPEGTSTDGGDDAAASDGAFPATVHTEYGDVTVDEKPERIVVLSNKYLELVESLGEEAVAFSAANASSKEEALEKTPWLTSSDAEFDIDLTTAESKASPETIATYEPDLIITEYWTGGVDTALYDQLSEIAPTYASPLADGFADWEDEIVDIGTLIGKSDKAAQVVADVDARFAEAKEALPGLQGKTVDAISGGDGEMAGSGSRFFERLGMVPSGTLEQREALSMENIEVLSADVLSILDLDSQSGSPVMRPSLEADPRWAGLPAVKNGTVVFFEGPLAFALINSGPLGIEWLLEQPEFVQHLADSELNQSAQ